MSGNSIEDLEKIINIIDRTSDDGRGDTFLLIMDEHHDVYSKNIHAEKMKIEDDYIRSIKQMIEKGFVVGDLGSGWDPCFEYEFIVPKKLCRHMVEMEMMILRLSEKVGDDGNEDS